MVVDEKTVKQLKLISGALLLIVSLLFIIEINLAVTNESSGQLLLDFETSIVFNRSLINLAIFIMCFLGAMYYFKYYFNSKIADSLNGGKLIINNGDDDVVNSIRLIKSITIYNMLFVLPGYYASIVFAMVTNSGIGSQNYLYWLNILPMFYSIFMLYKNFPNKEKLEGLITTYYKNEGDL